MSNEWVLALEQDSNLEVTQGMLLATADVVRRGPDLRFFVIARGDEETLSFQQTYVGECEAFAGLMTHHHSFVDIGSRADRRTSASSSTMRRDLSHSQADARQSCLRRKPVVQNWSLSLVRL